MRFVITRDRLNEMTLDELAGLEDMLHGQTGEVSLKGMRDLLARFVVDEKGEYLPDEAAKRTVGSVPVSQLQEIAGEFVKAFKDGVLPPENGGS